MLETVKIRKAGFPVRRTFKDFFSRYKSKYLGNVKAAGNIFHHGVFLSLTFCHKNVIKALKSFKVDPE